jgi:hypothetical protein
MKAVAGLPVKARISCDTPAFKSVSPMRASFVYCRAVLGLACCFTLFSVGVDKENPAAFFNASKKMRVSS